MITAHFDIYYNKLSKNDLSDQLISQNWSVGPFKA